MLWWFLTLLWNYPIVGGILLLLLFALNLRWMWKRSKKNFTVMERCATLWIGDGL